MSLCAAAEKQRGVLARRIVMNLINTGTSNAVGRASAPGQGAAPAVRPMPRWSNKVQLDRVSRDRYICPQSMSIGYAGCKACVKTVEHGGRRI
jgi:hypothetical protein